MLAGDFNERMGKETEKWPDMIGPHGVRKCNAIGELLLVLGTENELVITIQLSSTRNITKPLG